MYLLMQLFSLFVIRLIGKLVFCSMLIVKMIIIIYSSLFNDTFTCS